MFNGMLGGWRGRRGGVVWLGVLAWYAVVVFNGMLRGMEREAGRQAGIGAGRGERGWGGWCLAGCCGGWGGWLE